MIDLKYKKMYEGFLKEYESVHLNPWHVISKEEVSDLYDYLTTVTDVNDEISFSYMMNYIIKRLSGLSDAHTGLHIRYGIPLDFKILDNKVFLIYPEELNKSEVVSINGIDIKTIMDEIDDVICYGTEGGKKIFTEGALSNRTKLLGLPSLRGCSNLVYKVKKLDDEVIELSYSATEKFDNSLKKKEDKNCTFEQVDNAIIYTYNSCINKYEDAVYKSIDLLKQIDFDSIDTFIVDLRNNMGGSDLVIKPLVNFLKSKDVDILVLTNYSIFSSGRFAIRDFVDIGGITIGDEIGTPTNCYGNIYRTKIDEYYFNISSKYFNFTHKLFLKDKESFRKYVSEDIERELNFFKPDIYIPETIQDFMDDRDPVMEYALNYNKKKKRV